MEQLFKKFNIKPKNSSIYYQAFTHKTFANEKQKNYNYQRLEFLGDSILQLKSSAFIYKFFPDISEGSMTLIRSKNVDTTALSNHALNLGLNKYLRIGKGANDLLKNVSILADIFESFIGALYIDGNEKILEEILKATIYDSIKKTQIDSLKDAKTLLQEYLQSESRKNIRYEVRKKGELFIATIWHDEHNFGAGKGKTKKAAERNAANEALKMLRRDK